MIRARVVSLPTRAARKTKVPVRLTVPAKTFASGAFSTGRLSPVSMDSSTVDAPSVTTPSTGTRSPGRMRTKSPTRTAAVGTSASTPSNDPRGARRQRHQLPNGLGGAATGARLEPPAEDDQRDHHRAHVVVRHRAMRHEGVGPERHGDASEIGRVRANRHE